MARHPGHEIAWLSCDGTDADIRPDRSAVFLCILRSLERRRLISRHGAGRPFAFEQFSPAAPVNAGPLRVAFDGLKALGWLNQPDGNVYCFSGRAAALGSLPDRIDELFAWLAPARPAGREDLPRLSHWLELSTLDWNAHCPALIRSLDALLALALLRRMAMSGGSTRTPGGWSRDASTPSGFTRTWHTG
ncbi:hypothetical protein ACFSUI_24435 [Ralstonia solanacearum]